MITSLINDKWLRTYSPIPLNTNLDDIRPYYYLVEELYIKPLIGGILYEDLKAAIESGDIKPEYQTLLIQIYKYEAFCIAHEALPFLVIHFSEIGATLGHSENSDSIGTKEMNLLEQHLRAQMEARKDYFISWLQNFGNNFPLLVMPQCKVQPLNPIYKPCTPPTDIK